MKWTPEHLKLLALGVEGAIRAHDDIFVLCMDNPSKLYEMAQAEGWIGKGRRFTSKRHFEIRFCADHIASVRAKWREGIASLTPEPTLEGIAALNRAWAKNKTPGAGHHAMRRLMMDVHGAEPGADTGRLIILSLGLGRDSVTMVALMIEGKLLVEGKLLGPGDIDAVAFSDTGAEWSHSYLVIDRMKSMLRKAGVPFYVLAKPPAAGKRGWKARHKAGLDRHAPAWVVALADKSIMEKAAGGYYHRRAPIMDDYQRTGRITLRASAACTTNHKILPINSRLMHDLSCERFEVGNRAWGQAVRAGERRQHLVLIGYAYDERDRIKGAEGTSQGTSYTRAAYPLVEAQINKDDESVILKRHRLDWVRKSGCIACHFQPDGWYWALRKIDPVSWRRVVAYEATALARNSKMFLRGKYPIAQIVERWRARNPTATVDSVLSKSYERPCVGPRT